MTKEATEAVIRQAAQKIADEFQPEKIILFGSWAWGEPGPDSDVDLFVLKETDDRRKAAQQMHGALWGYTVPFDILVYTPAGAQRRLQMGDFFVRDILRKGKVLHERRRDLDRRMD